MREILFGGLLLVLASSAYASCNKINHSQVNLEAYYSNAAGLDGQELKSVLNGIIKGHKRYSYTPCVWAILKEADEDPGNPSNVIGIYTGRSIPKIDQDSGSNDPNSWNREHIWAKSHGFRNKSQHAYTDAHHLRAADRSVNSDRSNNDFENGGTLDDECTECREGAGTWEAPDRVKGDIARMMFYMATRYEGNDGSRTPDLELVDRKTHTGEPSFGKLCTLVAWHALDPVSNQEMRRNDTIHSWQGNRNPYIDHPEFVAKIWGQNCGSAPGTMKAQILERIDALESELNTLRILVEESM